MRTVQVIVPAPFYPLGASLTYAVPEEMDELLRPGSLVEVPLGARKTWGLVVETDVRAPKLDGAKKLKKILALKWPEPVLDAARLRWMTWLSEHYLCPVGLVAEAMIPGPVRKGTLRTLKPPTMEKESGPALSAPWPLNAAQSESFERIRADGPRPHLLWGVTGSGKTEIYLQLIEKTLAEGDGALVLVPEIALTPQLKKRFEDRFPGEVSVFHSGQSPKELRQAWMDVFVGKRRLAVGARSALFAPLPRLGLIVLDEEHDSSYKQEEGLRYHAREAAEKLAEILRVPLVCGSATPSAEALKKAEEGRWGLSLLKERAVPSSALPTLRLVDLKKNLAAENKDPRHAEGAETFFIPPKAHGDFFLSPELREALAKVLAKKEQAILFLNRRGVGSQSFCRSCGDSLHCPNCDVTLTPHKTNLLCHYCAHEQAFPKSCPHCSSPEGFQEVGVGTEAVEDALKLHFPQARVSRLDRDVAGDAKKIDTVLKGFAEGRADILIGTQMVAKGHDFPRVTLVGILLADLGLSVPDFRAAEKNLQLLLQVSGRAGRAELPGEVILQCFQPDHPVFQCLLKPDSMEAYREFMLEELAKRRELLYPPQSSAALLRFDGLELAKVREAAAGVGVALRKIPRTELVVLGPVASPLSKVRNRHRWQILVKATNEESLRKSLNWIFETWHSKKLERHFKARLLFDVDPWQML